MDENLNENLQELKRRMGAQPPELSEYIQFKINDLKECIISLVPFADSVIHYAVMNVLESIFERQFICRTYACRKGKGTHAAVRYALKRQGLLRTF